MTLNSFFQLPDLKILAYFSLVGNIFAFISYGIICYFMFADNNLPITTNGREAFGDIAEYPVFLGIVVFATSAVYIVVPLENAMKTPKVFTTNFGVLNMAFTLCAAIYVLIGTLGYLKYGICIQPSITFNLPTDSM